MLIGWAGVINLYILQLPYAQFYHLSTYFEASLCSDKAQSEDQHN